MAVIFIEGLDFHYAHFLPAHPRCGQIHGHTAHVKIALEQEVDDEGMVLDFAIAEQIAKGALTGFDHRLIVDGAHMSPVEDGRIRVHASREGRHPLTLVVAEEEICPLRGPSTIENITQVVASRIWAALGSHGVRLDRLEVSCTEGASKGARFAIDRDDSDR